MTLRRIAVLAGCVDITYFLVFLAIGMPVMAWPNLISLSMYAAAYVLMGRRRNGLAVLLMWTEVVVHAGACTLLLGWDMGAHYFLLVFLPMVAVGRSLRAAATALVFILALYIGLDALALHVTPMYPLSPAVATGLRWLSIGVVFAMFGYTGRYYVEEMARGERRLAHMATMDPLSGLWNRRHFSQAATVELERSARYGAPVALVLVDVDHFKRVNDLHGHPVGDRVLEHVATLLRTHLRSADMLARWGGEEFILLLPSTSLEGARQLCDRIRGRVENTPCTTPAGPVSVTLSMGVHGVDAAAGLDAAVKSADGALYAAKHAGRNRVCTSAMAPGIQAA